MTPQTPSEPKLEAVPDAVETTADPELDEQEDSVEPKPEPTPEPEAESTPEKSDAAVPAMDLSALRNAIGRQKGPTKSKSPFAGAPNDNLPASQAFDHSAFQDDFSDGKMRNFDDLFGKYPIGDGEYFVYIERKSPTMFRGVSVGGMQKPIEQQMDYIEFAGRYGKGTYMLTVYGPTPRGRLDEEGKLKRKAFTKPLKVIVPDPHGDNPPNPEMAQVAVADDEDEEPGMSVYGGRSSRRGGATDADAQIETARMEHESGREERNQRREDSQRERRERKERERLDEERSHNQQNSGFVERLLERSQDEIRELRSGGSNDLGGMAEILTAMKPDGPGKEELHRLQSDISEERRRAGEDMNRMRETHAREVDRIREEHRGEVNRLRDDNTRHEREERERVAVSSKDRDESARRQVEDARNESTRRITELTTQYESRIAAESRQHDRDLSSHRETGKLTSTTINSGFETRLEVKQQEINRLSTELIQTKADLEIEKGKTLADRVNEFAGAAESLGWSKDEGGEKDWKTMIGESLAGLVTQAPMVAANVMSSLKGVPPAPQLPLGQQGPAPQNYGPVYATDGVDMDLGQTQAGGPLGHDVIQPGGDLYDDLQPTETPTEGPEDVVEDIPQQPLQEQPQAAPQPQTQPQPQPQPQQTALVAPVQEEAQNSSGMNVSDEQILQFSEMFRQAFTQGGQPVEFAEEIIAQMTPIMAGAIVRDIPVARVTGVLQAAPTGDSDPLVRRDGQKFMAKVWELVKQKTPDPVAG